MPTRLDLFKALGDDTRYALYLELLRAARPLTTAEVAEAVRLHPNTVRPHLERMREVGLVCVDVEARGSVGRPQHRYAPAPGAPSLGLEPAGMPALAAMLVRLAEQVGAGGADAYEVGRDQGAVVARGHVDAPSCIEALVGELDRTGFDPTVDADPTGDRAVIGFANCPFRGLAEQHTEVVCSLHRGMVEGFVDTMGDAVVSDFRTLAHQPSCQVALSAR